MSRQRPAAVEARVAHIASGTLLLPFLAMHMLVWCVCIGTALGERLPQAVGRAARSRMHASPSASLRQGRAVARRSRTRLHNATCPPSLDFENAVYADDGDIFDLLGRTSHPCWDGLTEVDVMNTQVSLVEWMCMFQVLDVNHDRELSAGEWAAAVPPRPGSEEQPGDWPGFLFARIARLTKEENTYKHPERVSIAFNEMALAFAYTDQDGDYQLMRSEFVAAWGVHPLRHYVPKVDDGKVSEGNNTNTSSPDNGTVIIKVSFGLG